MKKEKSVGEEKNLHEIRLIQRCCSRDPRAQELLYRKYYGYAMGICLRYTGNKEDALELLNDSFLKIFFNINIFDQKKEFLTWIRKIIINTAIDKYRVKKKLILAENLPEDQKVYFQDDILDSLYAKEMLQTINELPDIYILVFNLYELEGYSHQEIGKILNINTSTSRSYLTRAKERLKKIILKLFADEKSLP